MFCKLLKRVEQLQWPMFTTGNQQLQLIERLGPILALQTIHALGAKVALASFSLDEFTYLSTPHHKQFMYEIFEDTIILLASNFTPRHYHSRVNSFSPASSEVAHTPSHHLAHAEHFDVSRLPAAQM